MADEATVTMSFTGLPTEISKTLTGLSASLTPANDDQKWYFKTTTVGTAQNVVLIAGGLFKRVAIAQASAHDTADAADEVKFLLVRNLDSSENIFLSLDNNETNAVADIDAVKVPANMTWFGFFDKLKVGDLHARASGSCECEVYAIIDVSP